MLAIILVALAAGALLLFYQHRLKKFSYFKNLGINGPPPSLMFGNLKDYGPSRKIHECYERWGKQYGKVFGYFEASKPVLMISDLEMLKDIFVKQFENFHGRKMFAIQKDPDTDSKVHMFFARGQRWKRLRSIINPTFSSSKLKQVYPLMGLTMPKFLKKLEEKADEGRPFDIQEVLQLASLDVICSIAFGLESDVFNEKKQDPFLTRLRKIFRRQPGSMPVLIYIMIFLPELQPLWTLLWKIRNTICEDSHEWIVEQLGKVVERRRNDPTSKRSDMMQLMLEAQLMEDSEVQSRIHESNGSVLMNESKFLTESEDIIRQEIKWQAYLFMLAGYETTSTTLTFACHELMVHPELQERIREEVEQVVGDEPEISYDHVKEMKYAEMFLLEVLRLYPVAFHVQNRLCMRTTTTNGLEIPAGMPVQINVPAIHHDPEIWGPDTHSLDPERFSPERKAERSQFAFLPFGAGPRECIGKRFALIEAKLTLAVLLRRFRVKRTETTEDKLVFMVGGATLIARNGVPVLLERR